MLNFDLSTGSGGSAGIILTTILLHSLRRYCCICDSLQFYSQYDYVLKKLNFDLLTPSVGVGGWRGHAGNIVLQFCCMCDFL